MKPHTLPVKRRPVSKGIFKRLSAVTGNRKQRVAAATSADMDMDDGGAKISRALTIVLLFHIVAIGLIFVHQKFLDGRSPAELQTAKAGKVEAVTVASLSRSDLPRLAAGDKSKAVVAGDNYARIAAAESVDENDLRLLNENKDIRPGMVLKIPPKRIVAMDPPEVAALRNQTPVGRDFGLVDAVPVNVGGAPRAQLVRPNITRGTQTASASVTSSSKTYTVQNGDSVWRIANRFKVNQDALMKANGLSDARKLRGGMNLVIPQ